MKIFRAQPNPWGEKISFLSLDGGLDRAEDEKRGFAHTVANPLD